MDNDKLLVGQKVKEIRKQNGLTQEKFCEKIGIEPSSLSNIETGKSFPSMGTILTIMEKFGITPESFFDFAYLCDNENLEDAIIKIVKSLPYEKKQIAFRILKQFVV